MSLAVVTTLNHWAQTKLSATEKKLTMTLSFSGVMLYVH